MQICKHGDTKQSSGLTRILYIFYKLFNSVGLMIIRWKKIYLFVFYTARPPREPLATVSSPTSDNDS